MTGDKDGRESNLYPIMVGDTVTGQWQWRQRCMTRMPPGYVGLLGQQGWAESSGDESKPAGTSFIRCDVMVYVSFGKLEQSGSSLVRVK